ncbi:MAG: type II secretion system protein [Patescibacteria group bacterium]
MIFIFNNVVEHNEVESNKGFTIPELLVSVSIILTIFAFAGINLLNIIPNSGLNEITQSFIADAKAQQNSAMLGESAGASLSDYSIKINADNYTLFKGQIYVEGAPGNYTVKYPQNIIVSTGFLNSVITFSALSGEIKDYNEATNQVTFTAVNFKSVTIKFNKLGNVFYVNKI